MNLDAIRRLLRRPVKEVTMSVPITHEPSGEPFLDTLPDGAVVRFAADTSPDYVEGYRQGWRDARKTP